MDAIKRLEAENTHAASTDNSEVQTDNYIDLQPKQFIFMVDSVFPVISGKLKRDVGEFQAPDRPIDPSVFAHFNRQ